MTRSRKVRIPANDRRRRQDNWKAVLAVGTVVSSTVLAAWIAIGGARSPDGSLQGILPGIDLAELTPASIEELLSRSSRERCPCGCSYTLTECRHWDPSCPRSGPILASWVKEFEEAQSKVHLDEQHTDEPAR